MCLIWFTGGHFSSRKTLFLFSSASQSTVNLHVKKSGTPVACSIYEVDCLSSTLQTLPKSSLFRYLWFPFHFLPHISWPQFKIRLLNVNPAEAGKLSIIEINFSNKISEAWWCILTAILEVAWNICVITFHIPPLSVWNDPLLYHWLHHSWQVILYLSFSKSIIHSGHQWNQKSPIWMLYWRKYQRFQYRWAAPLG